MVTINSNLLSTIGIYTLLIGIVNKFAWKKNLKNNDFFDIFFPFVLNGNET